MGRLHLECSFSHYRPALYDFVRTLSEPRQPLRLLPESTTEWLTRAGKAPGGSPAATNYEKTGKG